MTSADAPGRLARSAYLASGLSLLVGLAVFAFAPEAGIALLLAGFLGVGAR